VRAESPTAENMESLYLRATDLKGLGATYGFPLITRIAGLLCRLIDDKSKRLQAPLSLIEAHIDAIKAAARDEIKTEDHPSARSWSRSWKAGSRTTAPKPGSPRDPLHRLGHLAIAGVRRQDEESRIAAHFHLGSTVTSLRCAARATQSSALLASASSCTFIRVGKITVRSPASASRRISAGAIHSASTVRGRRRPPPGRRARPRRRTRCRTAWASSWG